MTVRPWRTACFILMSIPLIAESAAGARLASNDPLTRHDHIRSKRSTLDSTTTSTRIWCHEHCVNAWSSWSPCNTPCGRGFKNRTRTYSHLSMCRRLPDFRCSHSLLETSGCVISCPYGGLPSHHSCVSCPLGRSGRCCETEVSCPYPRHPRNGRVNARWPTKPGSTAAYSCNPGYILKGHSLSTCIGDGSWSEEPPMCEVSSCDYPGSPVNGNLEGDVFTFGAKVTFHCHRGYEMKGGSKTVECQSNGQWSGSLPTCEACPIGFFMDDEMCNKCPSNSLTATEASTSVVQCQCEKGFSGPPGGPCIEVFCTELTAPDHGGISECGNKVDDSCKFTCEDGFAVERGSTQRTCHNTGEWDGTQPFCISCKLNTYKSGERTCSPCPIHAHTEEPGQMLTGCVCDEGYGGPPGGPCTDVNECATNNDKGPCSDVCENNDGGYRCRCSIPGYEVDPQNHLSCFLARQCRNLTREDAPANGGLVCHWDINQNSQRCAVRCNPGFDFPSRRAKYVECGPASNFDWLIPKLNEPCIPELFPGFRVEHSFAYFPANCTILTEQQTSNVTTIFAASLNGWKACDSNANRNCETEDMKTVCGR